MITQKKGSAKLLGDGFEILIFGYVKYLFEIKKDLNLSKSVLDEAVNFIKYQYLAWETHIINEDKMKYYFASLLLLFKEKEMDEEEKNLINFIKKFHSNLSDADINKAVGEVAAWCQDLGDYNPFS